MSKPLLPHVSSGRGGDLDLKVMPLRHPLRWIAIATIILAFGLVVKAAVTNSQFQWPVVAKYLMNPLILDGLRTTIELTVLVMIFASAIGTVIALMMLSPSKLLSVPGSLLVWLSGEHLHLFS
ncbi:MAG: ABC transporter, permease protein (cluster 3, basic aa/glutamine/opines) [uncultured Paraburkholderia sp.]|nr:MAG: ABC transporter, permease protein (cluster 3, basic aa/glutamine/opines) [uncultured Paraburkholderia sp.]CAH2807091.1 MAG: ABC transporter, permease protein (cluster 3, basic aa/glutamine/opines) [uncultured Paraburkholderia sp.]CAH2942588.1 MAG: ABC transporter, permease protein (cluster 3, basic aa/glutamine/opines) [uncultured Paraburkholderia sp.]CAH2943503.1 MAG: ABC transporter, permease protein (cluster 3, basic aa/glutamine/opines) [uncultured Paraburkholderia sp.]